MSIKKMSEDLAARTGITKKLAQEVLETSLDLISQTAKKEGKLVLKGFGTFNLVETPARTGRNPQTGRPMKIKKGRTLRFKISKSLKDKL